ncbi:ATP-binding cassette domain-containing protein [Desulfobulbus sp.]|uniref:ATP-binding cassette domain-containing protein n=1 Tax=Desulfobulbus sp. TaxID=895 RepID=UPI00286FA654|nr:ATP-binding cassette domain-containing protein [Desulfobulbus sp.]
MRQAPSEASIRGIGLTVACGNTTICEHLHFAVPRGAVSVLAPRDALGKAALLNLLAGRNRPLAGLCLVEGHEAHNLPLAAKQKIGILENVDRIHEVMTIGQTALFFSGCHAEWRGEIYDRLTDGFGVSRRVKISNLPNHQRALMALAILLARNPDLLVLDDWITTFGGPTRAIVYDAIRRHGAQTGKTTLLVGHHAGLTPDLIDYLILMGHSTSLTIPTAGLLGADGADSEGAGHADSHLFAAQPRHPSREPTPQTPPQRGKTP